MARAVPARQSLTQSSHDSGCNALSPLRDVTSDIELCLARRQLSFWKPTGWGAEIQVTTVVDARR